MIICSKSIQNIDSIIFSFNLIIYKNLRLKKLYTLWKEFYQGWYLGFPSRDFTWKIAFKNPGIPTRFFKKGAKIPGFSWKIIMIEFHIAKEIRLTYKENSRFLIFLGYKIRKVLTRNIFCLNNTKYSNNSFFNKKTLEILGSNKFLY